MLLIRCQASPLGQACIIPTFMTWQFHSTWAWIVPKLVEVSARADINVMEWSQPCPLHFGCVAKLALIGLSGTLPNINGRGFGQSIVSEAWILSKKQIVESAAQDIINVMEWSHPWPWHWVSRQAHPSGSLDALPNMIGRGKWPFHSTITNSWTNLL
jgi:hypothetical protein